MVLLAMFILAASASAAVSLSGSNGKTILANLQNTSNKTAIPNNSSDFWSWGTVPEGHAVQNGSLIEKPPNVVLNAGEDSGIMETPAQALGFNDSIVNGLLE
ncbi:MAG: hypothetical protein WB392_12760 [Methanotrichaceae archaeon]